MSEEITGLHPNVALLVILSKDQRERLMELVRKKKFKDESEAIRAAVEMLLAS